MPNLRSATELMEPDSRSAGFVRVNHEGEVTPISIQHAEELCVEIEASLTSGTPEKIRERVKVAKSLIVYAWFCYDFFAVSMFWSFSCMEMALWAKYQEMKATDRHVEKYSSFKSLLSWASKGNLLPDGISPDAIAKMRNSMAHPKGFNIVMFPGAAFDIFELLIRVLAQLWPVAVKSSN